MAIKNEHKKIHIDKRCCTVAVSSTEHGDLAKDDARVTGQLPNKLGGLTYIKRQKYWMSQLA